MITKLSLSALNYFLINTSIALHNRNCIVVIKDVFLDAVLPPLPPENVLEDILETNAKRGFPGCIGSMDCTHVTWRAPKALQAAHVNKDGATTVVVQAVVQHNLRSLGLGKICGGFFAKYAA